MNIFTRELREANVPQFTSLLNVAQHTHPTATSSFWSFIRESTGPNRLFAPRVPLPTPSSPVSSSKSGSSTPNKTPLVSTTLITATNPYCSPAVRYKSRPSHSAPSSGSAPRSPGPSATPRNSVPHYVQRSATVQRNSVPSTVSRNYAKRTPHACSVVTNSESPAPDAITHFPSVDWQSNYHRAQQSLNKLKLVRFQNWETSSRTRQNSGCVVTQWIPSVSDSNS